MVKWSYLAAALGWLLSMVYEGLWAGGPMGKYIGWGVIGATLLGALFIRALSPGRSRQRDPQAMVWFLLAALVCALFTMAVERVDLAQPPHVRLLPLYPILFLDFLAAGCYTWWKKLHRKGQ